MRDSYRIGRVTMIPVGKVWHYRFRIDKQRRQRTTGEPLRNTAKAEAVASEAYQAALLRSRGEEPEPTLGKAVALWVEAHALRKSRSHVENIERWGRLHLGALAGLKLTELTTKVVEDAWNVFLSGHSKAYGNNWITYLRLVCRWAIKRRMIRSLPFDVAEQKLKKRPKPLLPQRLVGEWLEEVGALTEHEPSIGMALQIMLGLGLRSSEARQTRWEWLDLDRKVYTPGGTKGGEAWPRPVPDWLMEQLESRRQAFGWMVPTAKGVPPSAGRCQRVIDAACKAVGIPRITAHRLRGTYATWLSIVGVPIQDIAVALAHKDWRTTMTYLEVSLDRVAEGQRRIAARTGQAGRKSGEAHGAMAHEV